MAKIRKTIGVLDFGKTEVNASTRIRDFHNHEIIPAVGSGVTGVRDLNPSGI